MQIKLCAAKRNLPGKFFGSLLYLHHNSLCQVFQFWDFVSLCRVYRLYGSIVDTRLYASCTSTELLLSSKLTPF